MALLDQLRTDQITARKARDAHASTFYATLIGEAANVSDADRAAGKMASTDADVKATIEKFLKNAKSTRESLVSEQAKASGERAEQLRERVVNLDKEIVILTGYLPQQLSEEALTAIIKDFKAANPDAKIGEVMGHLKANHAGLYDGKAASKIAASV